MHDALFQNQRALGHVQLKHYAKGLGLNMAGFEACLDDGRHGDAVRADIAEAQAAGITVPDGRNSVICHLRLPSAICCHLPGARHLRSEAGPDHPGSSS
jgi:hypothetical protein